MADKKKRKRVKYTKVVKGTPILEFSTYTIVAKPEVKK